MRNDFQRCQFDAYKKKEKIIHQPDIFFFLAHFFLVGVEIFKQTLTTSCNELMF